MQVPEGWKYNGLDCLAANDRPAIKAGPFGSSLKKEFYVKSGYKVYGQEQVIANDAFLGDYFIDQEKYDELSSCSVQAGDILISLVGTIGRVLRLPENCLAGIINPRLLRISLDKTKADSCYFEYLLSSTTIAKSLARMSQGGTMGVLNAGTLKQINLLIPPLDEQQKIAKILSTWDKAITTTEQLLANSQQQKKALMQQLLTGKKRLLDENGKRFSGEWKTTQLGKVANMNSGGTPKSTVEEYYGGSIPWVSIADMTSSGKYITETEKYLTEEGLKNSSAKIYPKHTVLYAMYASIGECSIASVELASSQAILGIRPKAVLDYKYLYFYLSSLKEKIKLQGQQGTQSNLNAGMVKEFNILLPPLVEQQKIATVLTTVDQEIAVLEQKLEHLKQENKSLMQQLLTGKKRVKITQGAA